MPAKEHILPFLKKEALAENIYSFFFKKDEFDFLPGQYIRMILSHENADDRGTSRFFTISSSPSEEHIVITTKLLQSTFKHTLLNLEEGELVRIFGPLGTLVLPEEESEPIVFISGGMGITPFRSMLRHVADKNLKTSVSLISAFSKEEDMIFYEELSAISKEHKNIQLTFLDKRISEEILRENISDLQKQTYYLVGPSAMVEAIREILRILDISEGKVVTESFTGY